MSTTPAFSTMSATSPVVAVDDHAEVLRVVDLLHEDPRSRRRRRPLGEARRLRVLEDVVAEHDDERRAAGEVLAPCPTTCAMPPGSVCTLYVRSSSRIGSPPPRGASRPSPSRSIIWPGVALAGDEEDVPDPRQLEQLERVVDHRPAADREQVLVRDARQLAEARRLAAGADEALRLHAGSLDGGYGSRSRARARQARRCAVFRSRTPGTARTAAIQT